jgi:hypothetical protein
MPFFASMNSSRLTPGRNGLVAVALIMLVTCIVYWPGLRGPFVFDDQPNITFNQDIAITHLTPAALRTAALSNDSGPLKRPLAALSFGLNYYIGGGLANTFAYKVTNLGIHLINTVLVYWLSWLLIRRLGTISADATGRVQAWFPAVVAGLWALNPIQLTSVLYVVQRMTSLSALFVFAGSIAFVYGRLRLEEGRRYAYGLMTAALLGGLLFGIASKENAALLLPLLLVIEFTIFSSTSRRTSWPDKLGIYYALVIGLPCVAAIMWIGLHPAVIMAAYNWRDFTLGERLLTEARVLWFYLGLIVFPQIGKFGIYHDDILISTSLLTPWTTLPAVLGLIGATALAFVLRRRQPALSFAVLWFLVGQSMESSFIGLEIAHEHRNYLPSFGILFGVAYAITALATYLPKRQVTAMLVVCYLGALGFVTYTRAHIWMTETMIIENAAASHPNSARSQYMLGELYAEKLGKPIAALVEYKRAADLDTHDADALIKLVMTASEMTINGLTEDNSGNSAQLLGLPDFVSVAQINGRTTLQVSESVTKEIERRLREERVQPFTSFTLGLLSFCVNRGQKSCGHLFPTAVAWYELALQNPNNGNLAKGHLANGLAQLYLEHGDYSKALDAAKRSRQFDASNVGHWLTEAEVYLDMGRLEQAFKTIQHVQTALAPLDMTTTKKIESLLTRISAKREQNYGR